MITPNIEQIALDKPPKFWAEEIIKKASKKNEKDTKKYLLAEGYDIKENTKQYMQITVNLQIVTRFQVLQNGE